MISDSIGDYLKTKRETRRLSLEEVSSTTRIPRKALKCLEEDRFEDLPSGVFVRGFIKAYAFAVDIDAEEVLARFDEQHPAAPPAPLASVPRRRGYGGLLLVITTATLFAIIVTTFALVRRAPAQDDPIELSSTVPCQVEAVKVERSFCAPSTTANPTAWSRS